MLPHWAVHFVEVGLAPSGWGFTATGIAVLWDLHGAWIGGLSVCVLVVLLNGLMILIGRLRRKEATA
jgi:RsiW-degrading membrane proteinase PrsW (M82 family)